MNLKDAKRLIKENRNSFYVYVMKRPDGDPFYVGKGGGADGMRIACHENYAKKNIRGNIYKNNIINKISREGKSVSYDLFFFSEEDLTFDKEMELISLYGRKDMGTGVLSNLTPGGEGGNGFARMGMKHSEESKKKMSASHLGVPGNNKGYKFTEAQKKKMSESHKGIVHTEEQKTKISISNIKTKGTVEYRKKISDLVLGRKNPFYNKKHSIETRKKMSDSQKKKSTPEYLKRLSEAHLGHHHSEETRKKMSLAHKGIPVKGHFQSEETRRKISISLRRFYG